jgi:hypothetical protein
MLFPFFGMREVYLAAPGIFSALRPAQSYYGTPGGFFILGGKRIQG